MKTFWALGLVLFVGCGTSEPARPSARATISVPEGEVWALRSTCRVDWTHEEQRERVARFEIDRDPVSCNEWKRCVAAGKCEERRTDNCRDDVVEVGRRGAIAFCGWSGKRLPTWAEWSRAARGDAKTLQRNESQPCVEISHNKEKLHRCAFVGPTGMTFALTTHWQGEWTSEDDCYEINGNSKGGLLDVTVGLGESALSRIGASVAAFRCVKSAE